MELEREYLRGARRKARAVKDYFDDDDVTTDYSDTHSSALAQQNDGGGDEDEVDPLDAFMMGIETQVVQERQQVQKKPFEKPDVLNHGDDADGYMDEYAKNNKQGAGGTEFDDSDEEVYAAAKRMDQEDNYDDGQQDAKKTMEVLAPVDHSQVAYESFRKCFYTPHADIQKMAAHEVDELRRELAVRTEGVDVPQPIRSFVHLGFDRKMLALLMKLGLEAPTAIQAQAFPVALSGRDMIGIAKTGSGKTLAFTLPMVRHVMDQRELRKDEGPIAIVLSPTRELAHQIFVQAKKFLNVYGAECAAIYGGVGKWEQIQAIRKGAEVVVATPGRLIEMIRKKTVKMNRVTFVVLDEADRMFEMGFEPQLRSIIGQIRPDRQTLMFSATFRRRIEALALDILDKPVKVMIGQIGQANEDIHQIAVVLPNDNAKWPWLMDNLKRIANEGRVLIFAGSKMGCETLTKNLNAMKFLSWCLHGDKSQQERTEALAKFKTGECQILVATDVASRGLDVKDVKTVVNFDVAKNIDIHVHRIGRTGRMGLEGFEPGTAYTLVTAKETQFAAQLVHNMDVSGQSVAPDLISLAKHDPRFRRGTPAKRSVVNGASSALGSAPSAREEAKYCQQQHQPAAASEQVEDDEDAQEMERWSESRRKSKTDQRKGLGFFDAPGASGGRGFGAGTGRNFIKASSAASLSSSFQSAFVKSTTAAPPVPASVPWGQHKAPSQAPPPPPLPQAFQPVPSPAVQVSQSFPPPLPHAYQPILSPATQVPPPPQAYQPVPVSSPSVQVPLSLPPPLPQLSVAAKATDVPVSVGNVVIQQVTRTPPRPTAFTASSSKTWPQDTARQEPGTKVVSTNGVLERDLLHIEDEIGAQVALAAGTAEAEVQVAVEVTTDDDNDDNDGVQAAAEAETDAAEAETDAAARKLGIRALGRARTTGATDKRSPVTRTQDQGQRRIIGVTAQEPSTKSRRACIFSVRLTSLPATS